MNERQLERICDWNTAVWNYKGCGVNAELEGSMLREEVEETVKAIKEEKPEEVIDGAIDTIFVAIGTLHKMGLSIHDITDAMDEVIESNFTKFPFSKREDGKVKKSERFKKPNLSYCVPGTSVFDNGERKEVKKETPDFEDIIGRLGKKYEVAEEVQI